jgi:signal transduction histidine kinase
VDLVEDALRMTADSLARCGVSIRKEFQPVPPVRVDKHKVLQILINLLRNAKYAMDAARRPDKVLTLGMALNGEDRIKITVRDNGVGISPDHLTRLFQHGFTTRKDGHGFGLHSGLLAAKELGGALYAASQGLGQGALFTLELPLAPGQPAPAAR